MRTSSAGSHRSCKGAGTTAGSRRDARRRHERSRCTNRSTDGAARNSSNTRVPKRRCDSIGIPAAESDAVRPASPRAGCGLYDADLVLVHEWTDHKVVERIGKHKAAGGRYVLLFHDTHHRSLTSTDDVARYDLQHYDGVLAVGEVIRERYVRNGWNRRAYMARSCGHARVSSPHQVHISARRRGGSATGEQRTQRGFSNYFIVRCVSSN